MVISFPSSEFWTVFPKLISRRFFLSISLPEQFLDGFSPHFSHTAVEFLDIFLLWWFPFITIGFQIAHMGGKQEKYFCVLTLFPSNTYKGKEGMFLAPFWGNLIPPFLLTDKKEMLFPFSAQRKEQHLVLSSVSRNPPAGEKTKRAQISNQESGWRPSGIHLRASSLILSASETEKVYFNMLTQPQQSGKAIFCCGKLSIIKSTHLFWTLLLC